MKAKETFLRFWKSDNSTIALIRDIVVALLAVLIVLLILWTYTGQWFGAPMVAIESGSMEHPENAPFGRLGTIDAGDMVLVQNIQTRNDIITHGGDLGGAQAENGWQSYGDYGDVIIFKPLGRDDTPQIIHRAMCWVDVNRNDSKTTYTIAEYGIFNEENEKFEMLTRVASGFSDEDLEEFNKIFEKLRVNQKADDVICSEKADVWFKPEIIIEISGDELTISLKADAGKFKKGGNSETGYSVRFPVFQRIREDKSIHDITTVDEIIELFNSQGS